MPKYITPKTFEKFCHNQDELVRIINYNMSKLQNGLTELQNGLAVIKTDVSWTKKILWSILGLAIVSLFTIIFKTMVG